MSELIGVNAHVSIFIGEKKIETPYILSANVSRSRGQLVSTAAVTYLSETTSSQPSTEGVSLIIKFFNQTVFSGEIRKISIGPSARCAGEHVVRIQAQDPLYKLENKVFTRRQKLPGLGPLAIITQLSARTYVAFDAYLQHDICGTSSPVTIYSPTVNMAAMTQFVRGGETNTICSLHPVIKNGDTPLTRGKSMSGGMILHSHETLGLDERGLGPARSVFGVK